MCDRWVPIKHRPSAPRNAACSHIDVLAGVEGVAHDTRRLVDLAGDVGVDGQGDLSADQFAEIELNTAADRDADHLDFISNDIIDSFSILGPAEEHVKKLKELEAAGVTQFNIYLMCGEEERLVAEYASHVLPHFR